MSPTDLAALDPAAKRALLAARLKRAPVGEERRSAPLSLAQQRLWFIDQASPGRSVYTISAALRLAGDLDVPRLSAALDRIRARHASLRTRFVDEGGAPVQIVDAPAPLALSRLDLSARPGALETELAAFVGAPFDLAAGPLVRCALFRTAPREHVLAFAVHHIVVDYRSLQVMIRELAALYPDPEAELPRPPIQYADHALAQRRRSAELAGEVEWWRRALDGLPPLLELPTDHPRPPRQDHAGARHRFALSGPLTRRIEALAKARGATVFMVLLAGFHVLLGRLSGSGDVCVGATVSNRDRAELQGLVGCFVNTLSLRARIEPEDSFDSLLARIRIVVTEAMARQETPFEQVVEAVVSERSLAHAPLFQSMFNLHEKQPDSIVLPGLEISTIATPGSTARFDLSLDMFHGKRLTGVLEYATALFAPETAARFAAAYLRILDEATAEPARQLAGIDLVEPEDRLLLDRFNDTARPVPPADLATLLAARAAERGEAAALIAGATRLGHAALDAAANRLASHLAPLVPPGGRVAICLPRTADLVTALLAALKLGSAYVPLDPTHPPARLSDIVEAARPALMIVDGPPPFPPGCPVLDLPEARAEIEAAPPVRPDRPVSGDDLAYVIFTSGTTGRPKGVPIRQRSLVNLLTSMAETPGMGAADTLVAVTTPAFDIAALELFLPLLTGGTLVLADTYDVIDGLALSRLIGRTGATTMQATPATWRLLVEEGWRAPAGFRMLCGGEALDPALAARLIEGGGRLWNLYGPTETTIWSACAEIGAEDCARSLIPLGAPVANTTLRVLDPAGMDCPPGVAGELHIGGLGLSPGYLDRPDLTAERFVLRRGERLYRTGDRARRLADGTLVYLGRLDFQVKLRGFRIELGEIEGALAADPAVEQAVVALAGEGEDAALVAFCRAAPADGLEARLRARLAERLPAYMIPSRFLFLDAFPLNANGKVDRRRLPAPEAPGEAASAPPETETETMVSELWGRLLEAPPPGREADFFALGGHSLLAMRMIARLPLEGSRAAALRLLFENPLLSGFAAALDAGGMLRAAPPPPIPRLPEGAARPLSYAQARQWTLDMLDPGKSAYNLSAALRLRGPLDVARVGGAWSRLCERHEVLRSAYPEEGGAPRVVILPPPAPEIACPALSGEALTERLRAEAARPFDLSTGPLARIALFASGPGEHVLVLTLHHIVGDAISLQLVLGELMEIYAALGADPCHRPRPLPAQYADYAAWRRGQDVDAHVRYWVESLRGAPPLLDLPTDFPRPARQDFAGGSVDFTISGEQAAGLRTLAEQQGATPYMALLAAYAVLLGRYAQTDEVVIGTPVTTRPHPDLEGLAGMFVDTLVHRLPTESPAGFRAVLASCRERVVAGLEHGDAPFERVVEALDPDRSWSHNPVFQTMFSWKTREVAPPDLPDGLTWETLNLPSAAAKLDLTLGVLDLGGDFAVRLEYRRDLFRPETAANMAMAFEALIGSLIERPDLPTAELSLLHPDQARQLDRWNETGAVPAGGPETIHGLLSERAAREGDRVAIRDGASSITYAALDARSDALAAHLQRLGIGRGDRVGIALPRRIDLVAAMLATLKAGAAYAPLDPAYPADRIAYVAEDAELSLILADGEGDGRTLDLSGFWDGPPGLGDTRRGRVERPDPVAVGGADLAYLIYTSGSTGAPKGVALEHRNAVARIRWAERNFTEAERAGVLGSTSICFDLSVFEIFGTLCLGGTLLLVDDLFAFPEAPFAAETTLVNTVPTPMAGLLRLGPLPASVRTICLAGEPLPPLLAERIHAIPTVGKLWNLFGPSEDTTYSTGMVLPRSGPFNIGVPILGTRAHVLDEARRRVPPGMPGELHLSGAGIGRGYWRRPELTAERFLPNPFDRDGSGPVMYRTGDRVRQAPDGSLDYLGRADRQVKVRGFRVEPGEVEAELSRLPGVEGAAVGIWRDGAGARRLVAWIEGGAEPARLPAELAKRLPAHLVPSIFVPVAALPRLPNGKLDRAALPAPEGFGTGAATQLASLPRPGLETRLAAIWRKVLGRDRIGRDDDFFGAGGDSILAIQVVAAAREEGIALSPRDLFQHPTLAALAGAASGRAAPGGADGPATGPQALTPIQRRFLERDLAEARHWNQAMVLAPVRRLDADLVERALALLDGWHDALRARFARTAGGWDQRFEAPGEAPRLLRAEGDVAEASARMQRGFDLARGPLWGAVLCEAAEGGQRLAVAAHHLVVDGVSWRILLDDLQRVLLALEAGEEPPEPRRGASVGAWAEHLGASAVLAAERGYWEEATRGGPTPLPFDDAEAPDAEVDADRVDLLIEPGLTRRLLEEAPAAYPVSTEELLLAALYIALRDWTGEADLALELESHGRPDLEGGPDLSRTVGWLTALYPLRLAAPAGAAAPEVLRMTKERLRAVPNAGVGYGALGRAAEPAQVAVRFNYLGRAGAIFGEGGLFRPAPEGAGPTRGPRNLRDAALEINAVVIGDRLRVGWSFGARRLRRGRIEALAEDFARRLEALATHCVEGEDAGFTPADFPEMDLAQDDLEDLLRSLT